MLPRFLDPRLPLSMLGLALLAFGSTCTPFISISLVASGVRKSQVKSASRPSSVPRQSKQKWCGAIRVSKLPFFLPSYSYTSSSSIHRIAMSGDTAATTGTGSIKPNHHLSLSRA